MEVKGLKQKQRKKQKTL